MLRAHRGEAIPADRWPQDRASSLETLERGRAAAERRSLRAAYTLQMNAGQQDVARRGQGDRAQPKPGRSKPASRRIEGFENPAPDRPDAYLFLIDSAATALIAVAIFLLWQF